MFPFKQTLQTKNITPGTNTKQYIVIHHTATKEGSIKGVLRQLTEVLSCHFVVDTNGDAYKIGDPNKDILWHAGVSQWGPLEDMNKYSLGIEVIGPLKDGSFTRDQFLTVTKLVEHLMGTFNIPKENVLRHSDLTWEGSARKQLWDEKSRSRKVDIARSFFQGGDFTTWRSQLTPNKI